jgi:hypothetical protein
MTAHTEAAPRVRFEPPEHDASGRLREHDRHGLHPSPEHDDGVAAVGEGRVLVGEPPQDHHRQDRRRERQHDEGVDRRDPHVGPADRRSFLGQQPRACDERVHRAESSTGADEVEALGVAHPTPV